MNSPGHSAVLVAVMSAGTILLRFLPFLLFRKRVPSYVLYLGKVLPPAMIGLLVIYCLRNTAILAAPFGIPELIGVLSVLGLQIWKHNSLLSILAGTGIYMLLVQTVF
ncbi:MAG: AzlD domain-containing protein [Oscillospiraceae bacterium]|nr:AzlD domain-containing protein [Oscillospiraceae bacterium]MBR3557176.1 AzlD domain-containing protein [Oscillospiraceae bacterium]